MIIIHIGFKQCVLYTSSLAGYGFRSTGHRNFVHTEIEVQYVTEYVSSRYKMQMIELLTIYR
jgi:hypothetical protein